MHVKDGWKILFHALIQSCKVIQHIFIYNLIHLIPGILLFLFCSQFHLSRRIGQFPLKYSLSHFLTIFSNRFDHMSLKFLSIPICHIQDLLLNVGCKCFKVLLKGEFNVFLPLLADLLNFIFVIVHFEAAIGEKGWVECEGKKFYFIDLKNNFFNKNSLCFFYVWICF